MAPAGRERLIWSGLLVALLLVTPGNLPAQPHVHSDRPGYRDAAVTVKYGGILAVDANVGGTLILEGLEFADAKWGNDGKFAGFTGLGLNNKECDDLYEFDNPIYRGEAEAENVITRTSQGQTAYNQQQMDANVQLGFDYTSDVTKYLGNSVAAVYWITHNIAQKVCGFTEEDNENAPDPPSDPPTTEGVFYDMWRATRKLYDASQRNSGTKYLVNIARSLVGEFLTPLKQAGTIVQVVGKVVGQPAAEKSGKFVADLMEEPEGKMKKVLNTTTRACNNTEKFLNGLSKVTDFLDVIDTIWGITETFGILPWTYISCAQQEQMVRAGITQVRSQGVQPSSGRKLLVTTSSGVQNLDYLKSESERRLNASKEFREKIESVAKKMNDTITPPMTKAYEAWDKLSSTADTFLEGVSEALSYFDFLPNFVSNVLFGLSKELSFITECPDWACGLFTIVGTAIDRATNDMIASMKIRDVKDLDDLIKKALEEFGVPIPDWWKNGFGVDLDFDDVINLFDFLDDIRDAIDDLKSDLEEEVNKLLSNVLNLSGTIDTGTTIMDVTNGTATIIRRISSTFGTTIDIECPDNTVGIYMDSFTVWALPDCNADYTTWLRFPCAGNKTRCNVEWTKYDWKCFEYQTKSFPGVAGIAIPQRYVTAVYDCVSQAGLANFTLLPELLSTAKNGDTSLQNVDYNAGKDHPSVTYIKAFAKSIGRTGEDKIKNLVPSPKPGITGNGSNNPSVATAKAPYDTYSQGSLSYPLLRPFFEIAAANGSDPVTYTCSGAAVFGLPSLLIEGTDVDACYDTAYWQSFLERYPSSGTLDSTYDVRYYRSLRRQQVEALLSDMCGWRMVSKRGYIGALKGAINTTLQSMVPPMLLPWSGPPTEQQFKDFWGPRGACEHFSNGASGRSHLSYANWKVTLPSTAEECGQLVLGPICLNGGYPVDPTSEDNTWNNNDKVVCNTSSIPPNSQWPLVSPTQDPVLKTAVVPSTTCGASVPYTQKPNGCDDGWPSWCGPRASDMATTGPGATPDIDPALDPQYYFSKLSFYFADLSNSTVESALKPANLATPAQQWAAECSMDYIRGQEYAARKELLDAYAAAESTTLEPTCAAKLADCQLTKGSCPISEIFRCQKQLGIIQYACTSDPASTKSTLTLVFKVSLVSGAKQIGCAANQELQISSAEVGSGRTTKDAIKAVVKNMCNNNGTSCVLDINHPALNSTGPNDVLKVLWKCSCVPGYEDAANSTCKACDAGTYRSNNASVCTKTPPGSHTNTTASTEPTLCPAGTYADKHGQALCSLCPALTYSTVVGASNASTCIPCVGTNTYSVPGSSQCTTCPLGFVLSVDVSNTTTSNTTSNNTTTGNTTTGTVVTSSCISCPPGTYRTAAEEKCTACNPGTYAPNGGTNTSCIAAPAGYYAAVAGTIAPTPCAQGSYQPSPGSTSCLQCSNGTTTNTSGSTSAAACTVSTPSVPAEEIPRLEALANTPAGGSLRRRTLKAVTDPTGACGKLASALAELNLVANASTFLSEVGNSFCSASPWLNSPACNYDGGDCCPSTCKPLCTQVATSANDTDPVMSYLALSWSCSKFQCRDPAALKNNTRVPINCTGFAVSNPSSMLQRMLLPVMSTDVIDVEAALASIAPAKKGPAAGSPGVCDPHLNTEANGWDGGDCCVDSCKPNAAVPGSCTTLPVAACLDPRYNNPNTTQPPVDVLPPIIVPPADYTTTCNATLVATTGMTAYDTVDGLIPLSNPTVSSSNSQVSVSVAKPLPCAGAAYTVLLTWTAADKAGNPANATQRVFVVPAKAPSGCTGNPATPANAANFSCNATAQGGNCSTVCRPGYVLTNGSLNSVCGNGTASVWRIVTGVCSAANCTGPGPAAPENATAYNCSTTASGGNCSTTCLHGFSLAANSSLQITCRLGNWSTPTGICIGSGSGSSSCTGSPATPANARPFNCSAGATSCSTTCNAGNSLTTGSLIAVCSNGTNPVWINATGVCSPASCPGPGPAAPQNAANYSCPVTASGGSCSTTCLPGFSLVAGSSLQIGCSLGNWSTPTGICIGTGIGLLNCTGSPNTPTNARPFTCVAGTACSTTCNAGYSLTAGNLTAVCINAGLAPVWSIATGVCSPASCPGLGPAVPQNAANYNCPLTASGGNCSTTCLPGFSLAAGSSLQISCSLGNWSTPTGICINSGCTGPGPTAPRNAANYSCPVTASGGNCVTTCLPGYTLVPGTSLQTGCSLGKWSIPTGICVESVPLICSGSPATPANAKPFTCVGGTACTTVCQDGYSLSSGSLTAVCVTTHSAPIWSFATGVCSPASCPAPGPIAPTNAAPYNCPVTASGGNCSTTCLPGFSLAQNSTLVIRCSMGSWSTPGGICSAPVIIRAAEVLVVAVSSRRTNISLPSSAAGPIAALSRRSGNGRAEVVKGSDGRDLIMYLSKFGFIGNDSFTARTADGKRTNITVAVTPGSCDNNMCGLYKQPGVCELGRCICPPGSLLNSTFLRNPDNTSRALTPVVPACRVPGFTPTRAFSLTGMRTKLGQTLQVTFTLAQPGVPSECVGPDAELQPKVLLHRVNSTCEEARRAPRARPSAAAAAASAEEGDEDVQAAPTAAIPREIVSVIPLCQGGEYAASVTVPSRFDRKCIAVSVKLADNTTRRSVMQID